MIHLHHWIVLDACNSSDGTYTTVLLRCKKCRKLRTRTYPGVFGDVIVAISDEDAA